MEKKKFLIPIFTFFILFFSFFYFSYAIKITKITEEAILPYPVDLTQEEIDILKSLDKNTLAKIIQLANLVLASNASSASQLANQVTGSGQYYPVAQTNLNPATGQSYNTPMIAKNPTGQNGGPSYGVNPSPYGGGANDPDYGYQGRHNPQMDNAAAYQSLQPPLPQGSVDLSQLPPGDKSACQPFGVNGNIGNITPKLKFDMSCLCQVFGKKINFEGTTRGGACSGGSQHPCGTAIDIVLNNYKDRNKDAMHIVALIALGYNIGSYQAGFTSFHADHESVASWKTWSGVAHTNYQGGFQRPYIQQVTDALNLIGKPAASAAEFRSKYGRPARSEMMRAAQELVNSSGNETLKACIQNSPK